MATDLDKTEAAILVVLVLAAGVLLWKGGAVLKSVTDWFAPDPTIRPESALDMNLGDAAVNGTVLQTQDGTIAESAREAARDPSANTDFTGQEATQDPLPESAPSP